MKWPFFPTCQVRVVRFYVSCLLVLLLVLLLLLLLLLLLRLVLPRPPLLLLLVLLVVLVVLAQLRPAIHSVLCRTSTTTIHAQCSLPDLNHDHPRPVFPAGPQPRPSAPSVPLPDLNRDHPRPVFPAGPQLRPSAPSVPCQTSTATIRAQWSLQDLKPLF